MISNAKHSPSNSSIAPLLLFLSILTTSWANEGATQTSLRHTTQESTPGDKPKPDQAFCVGNGIKCDGGAFTKEGYFLKCEGGLKFGGIEKEMTEEEVSYDDNIIEEESRTIASGLRDHIVNGEYSLTVKDFMPSEGVIEQIDTMADDDTIEFGGFSVVGWGCKAKFFQKKNFMVKTAECGAKGMKGMGTKSMADYDGNAQKELAGAGAVDDLLENVSILIDEYFNDDGDESGDDEPKPDAVLCLEKGMKCMGAGIENKGGGAKCEGGGKFNMESKSTNDLAQLLHDHMNEGYLLQVEELMPSEEVLRRMQKVETQLLESGSDDDDGCEIEFGGFGKFEWGCKVTSSKKDKNVTAECGMKAMKGVGVKPKDIEDINMVTVSSVM